MQNIARKSLDFLAASYPIAGMKTIGQIRRENLLLLLESHGSLANINEKLDLPRTDATLSQIKNQSTTSRGKPKMMGETIARRIEAALTLPAGWMDNDQTPQTDRQRRIEHAMRMMEQMEDAQFDLAVRVIDTFAEPATTPRTGTH